MARTPPGPTDTLRCRTGPALKQVPVTLPLQLSAPRRVTCPDVGDVEMPTPAPAPMPPTPADALAPRPSSPTPTPALAPAPATPAPAPTPVDPIPTDALGAPSDPFAPDPF